MNKIIWRQLDDESYEIAVVVDGKETHIQGLDYDNDGWSGISQAESILRDIAKAFKIKFEVDESPLEEENEQD